VVEVDEFGVDDATVAALFRHLEEVDPGTFGALAGSVVGAAGPCCVVGASASGEEGEE
jgi:hypothetical protein